MAGIDDVNRHPVIHTWSYKLAEAACFDQATKQSGSSRRTWKPDWRADMLCST